MDKNKKKTLIVVDMQNDFIDGALGTKEAAAIVENVKKKIKEYADRGDEIIFTRDTHYEDYMEAGRSQLALKSRELYTSTRPALDIQDGETSIFRMLRW